MPDGYVDILSYTAQGDACLILPTLNHAINIWPIVRTMFREAHNERDLALTKTGIVCKDTQTVLKLWVPYDVDPTMPMDYPHDFAWHCKYLSVWYSPREVRHIVERRRRDFSVRDWGDVEASRVISERAGRGA